MEKKFAELKSLLLEINDIGSATAVLGWDQSTYMPAGGAPARGRQLATLGRIAHEKFTDAKIGQLLDVLTPWAEGLDYNSDQAALIRVTRRNYDQAVKIPSDLLGRMYEHTAVSYQKWTEARPNNDFASIQDNLAQTIEFSRQIANCFPGYEHIADPLIDFSDQGMKAESIRILFADLREQLVPIVKAITEQPVADDSCLKVHYDEDAQLAFGMEVAKKFGFDTERGRQDKTVHPFMTKFSIGDVRITTRVDENNLNDALFSTLHETGHALYEMGLNRDFEGSPLANGTSSGVHESQSRLWENLVGRSRGFWNHYYSEIQQVFPEQLNDVSMDTFYGAINKVERTLIRTESDEVTYNLHVMIRFDLELALLEGSLAVQDLPEAWHARYESDLGVRAPSDVNGVLQDVHWYGGLVGGAFQGYTLGNVMSAAFFDTAVSAHPTIPAQIEQGEFETLHNWLKENIYQHGAKFTADELVQRVTGTSLTIDPYIAYLQRKFGDLYAL